MPLQVSPPPSLPASQSPRLAASYAWGLDLSGTETGAGGVGGLLFAKLYPTTFNNSSTTVQPPSTAPLAPLYDGNGNILAYVDCATGQTLARYEYDPFGKLLLRDEDTRVAGRLHHQFSTKYTDDETGLVYYGYRYYSPELGRWVSRDPIGENGGMNLLILNRNDALNKIDFLGLCGSGCDALKATEMAAFWSQVASAQTQGSYVEYCGAICCNRKSGNLYPTEMLTIQEIGLCNSGEAARRCENRGDEVAAIFHSHPNSDTQLGGPGDTSMDKAFADEWGVPSVMTNELGNTTVYDPKTGKETECDECKR